jgi:hypothetical protein
MGIEDGGIERDPTLGKRSRRTGGCLEWARSKTRESAGKRAAEEISGGEG